MKSLSIIIPCFNEYSRLYKNLPIIAEYCDTLKDYELIFVDDGSTDNTLRLLQFFKPYAKNMHIITYTDNKGKGYAVRQGLKAATKDLVLFMDADLATDISCIAKVLKMSKTNKECVIIGNREDKKSKLKASPFRKFIGRTFVILQRIILRMNYPDTQCGFKLMSKSVIPKIVEDLQIDRWAFDVEILYLCKQNKIPVKSMPIIWTDVAGSKVHPIRDSWRMFTELIRIRRIHE
jgi:dolichyl-phosphate beta-glucosyltransferase